MAKKTYKKRSAEEKRKQVEELVQSLNDGVINFVQDPEKYKALLETLAMMPSYSFNNIMLAKVQLPHAQILGSFNHWKNLNRHVKKGEKAIRILAPRFSKPFVGFFPIYETYI